MTSGHTLIGLGKPAAPGDAVELLLECHGRIRAFLALANRLAEAREETPEALADAAQRVHRYFTLALPLHARDEEESLVPRLRGREPVLEAALDAMVREHAEHQAPLGVLVGACAEVVRDPGRQVPLAGTLAKATGELVRHFEPHLAREEGIIFPAVRRLLDGADDAAIVRELRLRRSVAGVGDPQGS
jgi:iron-sulfur cluster repair protein YtfE (RIC family)